MSSTRPNDSNLLCPSKSSSVKPMGSVRQPVSCEPCRRRKIGCSRTRAPCDTCCRRGCADHYVYKGSREDFIPAGLNAPNQELLDRISNLEALLKTHTATGRENSIARNEGINTGPMLSPPMEPVQSFHLSPGSFTSESSSHPSYPSERAGADRVRVLASSPNGNVRYEPRSSQWTAVLANTGLSIATPCLEDQDDSIYSSGFLFISSSIASMDEQLSILPPCNNATT
jgi:hypothetical protein